MDKPLYQLVAQQMQARIQTMQQGERLPSVRVLADELGVSHSTVIEAYRALEQAGFCYSRPRSGMFALPAREEAPIPFPHQKEGIRETIDFMSGVPGADAFPFASFKQAISDVLDADREKAFTYQPVYGYEGLRVAIAAMMERQGVPCQAENVLVTSGAQQALDIVARQFLRPGGVQDAICMENPSYPGAQSAFAARGARILGIPVTTGGMDLDLLEAFARRARPKLVYTMPLLQTPTATCMGESDMQRLCLLSEKLDFYILEEDVVGELLDVPRKPLYAIAPQRVIYIKSFSKIMMPGIRTGFLLAQPQLVEALSQVKGQIELSASGLIQRALCRCLDNDTHQTHVNSLRSMFQGRRELASSYLNRWKQWGLDFRIPEGGVDFWLTLPEGLRDSEVTAACLGQGVSVGAGSRYYCTPMANSHRHLRFSVAASGDAALNKGLPILGEVLRLLVSRKAGKLYIE